MEGILSISIGGLKKRNDFTNTCLLGILSSRQHGTPPSFACFSVKTNHEMGGGFCLW